MACACPTTNMTVPKWHIFSMAQFFNYPLSFLILPVCLAPVLPHVWCSNGKFANFASKFDRRRTLDRNASLVQTRSSRKLLGKSRSRPRQRRPTIPGTQSIIPGNQSIIPGTQSIVTGTTSLRKERQFFKLYRQRFNVNLMFILKKFRKI